MKKIIVFSLALVLMCSVLCAFSNPKSEMYAMTTVVTEVDAKADKVVCIDFNGNEWEFEGAEDWFVGAMATMIMNDCGTPIIYDDEIISVRYDGWLDGSWGWDGQQEIIIIEK